MDKDNDLIKFLREGAKNGDFSSLKTTIPYQVRLDFFNRGQLINKDGNNVYNMFGYYGMFEHLFTDEEAIKLIKETADYQKRFILILCLPDEEKLRYLPEIIQNKKLKDIIDVIAVIKNEELKNKAIEQVFQEEIVLSPYHVAKLIEMATGEFKSILFDMVLERQKETNEEMISAVYISEILNNFSDDKKLDILDKIISFSKQQTQSFNSLISNSNDDDVLKCFKNNGDRLEALKKMYAYLKEKYVYINISELLKCFPQNMWKELIKILIDKFPNEISYFVGIGSLRYDNPEYLIDIGFELETDKNRLISSSTLMLIIEPLPIERKKQLFYKYIIKEKRFELTEALSNIRDLDFKYSIIEDLITNREFSNQLFEEVNKLLIENIFYPDDNALYPDSDVIYPKINELYSRKYNIKRENLDELIKKFGYISLSFISNQNILNTLNMEHEEFMRYLAIFDSKNTNLSNDDINNVGNAFFQREFRITNPEDYNIFATIEHLIALKDDTSQQKLESLFHEIMKYIDIQPILEKEKITLKELISKALENNKEAMNIIHEITNNYIAKKRDIYSQRRLSEMYEQLKINKIIEKSNYKKSYLAKIDSKLIIRDIIFYARSASLTSEEQELIDNDDRLKKIIDFKKNPQKIELTKEMKKYLKAFESLLNVLYEQQVRKDEIENRNTVYTYIPIKTTSEELLNIMLNINPEIVSKNVLSNNQIYQKLLEILEKYHLLGWNNTFKSICETSDIIFEDGTLSGIISYFNEIYPKLDLNTSYLTKLLDYGNLYDYTSCRYRYLLGKEDYALIAANEGKNKASMRKYDRLKQSEMLMKQMYERKYTTVPPMDKNVLLSNGKEMNIVIGNTTNTMNLTYGERTEACLRIGGVFAKLFNFCIENENGFHIRFSNPQTNTFVSRVSGIRNGNTLFLNELRESVDKTYNNEEIIEALKIICRDIIEESKKSNYPIDNVVITSDYALSEHSDEEQDLKLNGNKLAVYELPTNIDLNGTGIILVTSNQDNSLVPYKFDSENIPRYACQRDKIKIYKGSQATSRIIQLHMISSLLEGIPLDKMNIEDKKDYELCISGEDWYIAQTKENKILVYIMPNSKQKEKAIEEAKACLRTMQEKLRQEKKEEELMEGRTI